MKTKDLQAIKSNTMGCYWPSKGWPIHKPLWDKIASELKHAALIEYSRCAYMNESTAHADELKRLAVLAEQQATNEVR